MLTSLVPVFVVSLAEHEKRRFFLWSTPIYGCGMQAARTLVPEPTVNRKTCTKCKLNKPAADFFRFKFSSDGLQSYCKACSSSTPHDASL